MLLVILFSNIWTLHAIQTRQMSICLTAVVKLLMFTFGFEQAHSLQRVGN